MHSWRVHPWRVCRNTRTPKSTLHGFQGWDVASQLSVSTRSTHGQRGHCPRVAPITPDVADWPVPLTKQDPVFGDMGQRTPRRGPARKCVSEGALLSGPRGVTAGLPSPGPRPGSCHRNPACLARAFCHHNLSCALALRIQVKDRWGGDALSRPGREARGANRLSLIQLGINYNEKAHQSRRLQAPLPGKSQNRK